jgi:hypothetical protein
VDLSERQLALNMAIMTPGISTEAVVDVARSYLRFMQGADDKAPAPTPEATAPKASRGKKAATAGTAAAEPGTAATANTTAADPTPAAPASPSNDMFGEEAANTKAPAEAAAATPAGNATQPKKDAPAASGKAKAPTLDEVRAAMVDVQTKCGGKEAAKALLVKFTTGGKALYSELPEGKYADLIAACKKAVDVVETTK